MIHDLKILPVHYNQIMLGYKNFELRKDDRLYSKYDILRLMEWLPDKKEYSGNIISVNIIYILRYADSFGLKPGYVIMGFRNVNNCTAV